MEMEKENTTKPSSASKEKQHLPEPLERGLEIVGRDNLATLYYHLHKAGINESEILDRPEEFTSALKIIFEGAYSFIERSIVTEVCKDLSLDPSGYDMAQILRKLKQREPARPS
jgi:hypothetical protein